MDHAINPAEVRGDATCKGGPEPVLRGRTIEVPLVRHPRTHVEMAAEAAELRLLFPSLQWDNADVLYPLGKGDS